MPTWQSGGPEPVPPEVPVFPVGTMVPGSNFGHRQRAQLGDQFVALQGARDDLLEDVDDVTHREAFALFCARSGDALVVIHSASSALVCFRSTRSP